MALALLTPPAVEPVTLAEARQHLRVDHEAEDALIAALIRAAREAAEAHTGLALIAQGWRLSLDAPAPADPGWWDGLRDGAIGVAPDAVIALPRPPLVAVTEVRAYDASDAATVIDPASYYVDTASRPGRLVLRAGTLWPASLRAVDALAIDFTAGFGDAAHTVPQALRQGLLAHVAQLYAQRGDGPATAPAAALALYAPFRVHSL